MSNVIPTYGYSKEDPTGTFCQIVEFHRPNPYDASHPHRHSYFELFLFSRGGGVHMIDFEEIQIETESMHLVGPGQVHMVSRTDPSCGHVILFPESLFLDRPKVKELLFHLLHFDPDGNSLRIAPDPKVFEEVGGLVSLMKSEQTQKPGGGLDIVRNYLHVILLKCMGWSSAKTPSHTPSNEKALIHTYISLVNLEYLDVRKVSEYAESLNVGPDFLNQVCKKLRGKTAGTIIHERICLEAKRLLLHSPLSTKEIAYTLNFDDPSYFSRFFRKQTGSTPTDFRIRVRKKYPL